MKLEFTTTLDATDMTLLEFAAIMDRVKMAIDPDGPRRYVKMRLGSTEGIGVEQTFQYAAVAEGAPVHSSGVPGAVGPNGVGVNGRCTTPAPDHLEEQRYARAEILRTLVKLESDTTELIGGELREDLKIGQAIYVLGTHRQVVGAMIEYLKGEDAVDRKVDQGKAHAELAENPAVR